MYLNLDFNLATFQYIDGFGCYHFCLTRFGLELIIFFRTFCNFWFSFETADYFIDESFSNPLRFFIAFVLMLSLVSDQRNKPALLFIMSSNFAELV